MGNCCSDAGPGAPKPIEDRNAARKKQAEDDARKKKAEEDAAAAKKAEEADPVHTWTNAHMEGNHQQDLTGAGEELVKLLDGMSSVQPHRLDKLDGISLLPWAVDTGHLEAVELLLRLKVNVDCQVVVQALLLVQL